MATQLHIRSRGTLLVGVAAVAVALVGGAPLGPSAFSAHAALEEGEYEVETVDDERREGEEHEFEGFAGRVPDSRRPKISAYFLRESYPGGATARLVIANTARHVRLQA